MSGKFGVSRPMFEKEEYALRREDRDLKDRDGNSVERECGRFDEAFNSCPVKRVIRVRRG